MTVCGKEVDVNVLEDEFVDKNEDEVNGEDKDEEVHGDKDENRGCCLERP